MISTFWHFFFPVILLMKQAGPTAIQKVNEKMPDPVIAEKSINPSPVDGWADSVLNSLNDNERIAQLMVIRTSAPGKDGKAVFYHEKVDSLVKEFNIGGVCLFQGTPEEQAQMLNRIQNLAKTPIMVTVDGEWGLGMRFAGVKSFPYQLTMGAVNDASLVYQVGKAMADQCRRMNIHVNYAPVVDVNNNPNNPVIGLRSFGENPDKVALFGTQIMKGMQDNGVMACAKHFPGHGDVSVDSHYDLPVIHKSLEQLDSLELYPFKAIFSAGVGSVMIAHLSIPAIDSTPNKPTSISYANVTELMRNKLGYKGLTFTDALEMKGVSKFYPGGEAAVQSLIAGNDMLCLPEDVAKTIEAVKTAISNGRLSWDEINEKCRRVLAAKYEYVAGRSGNIETRNLDADLNRDVNSLRKAIAEKAFTLLRQESGFMAVPKNAPDVLHVQIGGNTEGAFAASMRGRGATVMHVPFSGTGMKDALKEADSKTYRQVVVTVQGLTRNPAQKFGMNDSILDFIGKIGKSNGSTLIVMGNPYGLGLMKYKSYKNIAVGYEDDAIFQNAAFDWLTGLFDAEGTLPVSIGEWKAGMGIIPSSVLPGGVPESASMDRKVLDRIETIAKEGIDAQAFPGCVVTVVRKGKVVYQRGFGSAMYGESEPVSPHSVYDLASVTKVSATTLAVMKLYEEGKLDLKAPLGQYLEWLRDSDKANITIESMLLHQSGFVAFIPFYREVTDGSGNPSQLLFSETRKGNYILPVTGKMNMQSRWRDTMFSRIKTSKLIDTIPRYVYSDNNFILLAEVVESITKQNFSEYVNKTFYRPLGLHTTGFKAFEKFSLRQVVPTENEKNFRQGLLWGYVHDPGAAMFGNVAGHAGLFSSASDLAKLYQMVLNGGKLGQVALLKPETIALFTQYNSDISRRGYGYDKPERGNDTLPPAKKYPATYVSPQTFGHTGYTGTCVWVDPLYDLVYIFLSNRVHPTGGDNRKILTMNIRSRIQDVIYESMTDRVNS